MFKGECVPKETETIIPETFVVGCVTQEIEKQVKKANQGIQILSEVPPKKLFVTPDLQGFCDYLNSC